ncbi:glycosyltransferase family 39 protein [Nitrospinae bacterium AH_259_B05_G02_I21]|nr:glycosyltransferase family 39 protein [Nitrospinae bacterium AH_259_B05_G02_I21]MDA2931646.1 glycosyltransferase family 39 protein [Nitrospinae bacterium AH-259-F20]
MDSVKASFGRKEMAWSLALAITASCVLVVYIHYVSFEWSGGDSSQYAQLGRNLYEGKGFVTDYVYTRQLLINDQLPQPESYRTPLHPLLIALSYALFGVSEFSARVASGLFFVAVVPLIYVLGIRLFSHGTGLFAAALFTANLSVLKVSGNPVTEPLFTFIMTCFFLSLLYMNNPFHYFGLGLLLGAAYLTRPIGLLYAVGLVGYWVLRKSRIHLRQVVAFGCGFVVVSSAFWLRNYWSFHNPFFSISSYAIPMNTELYPGGISYLNSLTDQAPLQFVLSHPAMYFRKYAKELVRHATGLTMIFNVFVLPFFILYLFDKKKSDGEAKIYYHFLLLFGITIFSTSLVNGIPRYQLPLYPVMVLFASHSFMRTLDHFVGLKKKAGKCVVIIVLGLSLLPLAEKVARSVTFGVPTNALHATGEWIQQKTPPEAILLTDDASNLSWYARRRAIYVPWKPNHLNRLVVRGKEIPFSAIVLTSHRQRQRAISPEWKALFRSRRPLEGFMPPEVFKKGQAQVVLYRREAGRRPEAHSGGL